MHGRLAEMSWSFEKGDALVLVDVQNDFLPGGSLAVSRGAEIVSVLDHLLALAAQKGVPSFASRDFHPPNHCSFRAQGGPWPPHGVQGTQGAELSKGLHLPPSLLILDKGTDPDRDAYSAFEGTGLDAELRARAVRRLFVGGLVTEYCVLETVRAALSLGYRVVLLEDGIASLDPRLGEEALETMRKLGASAARAKAVSP